MDHILSWIKFIITRLCSLYTFLNIVSSITLSACGQLSTQKPLNRSCWLNFQKYLCSWEPRDCSDTLIIWFCIFYVFVQSAKCKKICFLAPSLRAFVSLEINSWVFSLSFVISESQMQCFWHMSIKRRQTGCCIFQILEDFIYNTLDRFKTDKVQCLQAAISHMVMIF
jgi:hypothetical protein